MFPPDPVRTVPGGNAVFRCASSGLITIRVQWLVNGTLLENLNLMNVTEEFTSIGGGIGLLQFKNLPIDYNMTEIQCEATLSSETTSFSINVANLLIFPGMYMYNNYVSLQLHCFNLLSILPHLLIINFFS